MNKKCKDYILEVLKEFGSAGLAGGILEDRVREISIYKSSTVSRVARDMASNGKIQRGEFMAGRKKCVRYRVI